MTRLPLIRLLLPLLLVLPGATPARATTVRVDWSTTLEPLIGSGATGTRSLSGGFGTYELPPGTSFPAVFPLNVPFTATGDFGPNPVDVYTFTQHGGIGFAFGSPSFGRIVQIAQPSYTVAGVFGPGALWDVTFDFFGTQPVPMVSASIQFQNGAFPFLWAGMLAYQFTVVPEPASAVLLGVGLLAIAARRR